MLVGEEWRREVLRPAHRFLRFTAWPRDDQLLHSRLIPGDPVSASSTHAWQINSRQIRR